MTAKLMHKVVQTTIGPVKFLRRGVGNLQVTEVSAEGKPCFMIRRVGQTVGFAGMLYENGVMRGWVNATTDRAAFKAAVQKFWN